MKPSRQTKQSLQNSLFGALFLLGSLQAHAYYDPTETSWKKSPEVTVPVMLEKPDIDGTVSDGEWRGAAQLSPFVSLSSGVGDEFRREAYIAYGPEELYIAFCIHRPEGAIRPTGEDFIELMFNPSLDFETGFNFWIHGDGSGRYGLLRPHTQWVQTPAEWEYAVRHTSFGWEGETAIPYALLGAEGPPSSGTTWGFDFVDNRRTPFRMVSQWSYRGVAWRNFKNFGRLRFEGPVPAARFENAGPANAEEIDTVFSVANTTGHPARLTGGVELFRRKAGAEGGVNSYLYEIEQASDDDYEAGLRDFHIGAPIEQRIGEAMESYRSIGKLDLSESPVDVPAGQSRSFGVLSEGGEGEYLVVYNLTDATTNQNLMRGVSVFEVAAPLEVTAYPFWLNAQVIEASADLRKVTVNEPALCRFEIINEDGETFDTREISVEPKALEAKAVLDTEGLPVGFYQVMATLISPNGEEIAANFTSVEKPPTPEWHANDHGLKLQVPPPWTPVKANRDGIVEVWGRTYDLGTLLPRSIISQGDEILARPMILRLIGNGEELPGFEVGEFRLEEATDRAATYFAKLENNQLVLSGTVRIEFDGFAWYDLRLEPKEGSVELDRAALEMAVSGKYAELMDHHRLLHDPALSQKKPEPTFTKRDSLKGLVPAATFPFSPYVWIGNERAGIGFIAEAPIDWVPGDPAAMMEISPAESEADEALFQANVINEPTTLEKPMRLIFGIQATPIRQLPSVEKLHIAQSATVMTDEEKYAELSEAGGNVWVGHSGWRGPKSGLTWGGWPAPVPDPEKHQDVINGVQAAHENDIKVAVYTGWGIVSDSEEWRRFGNEMAQFPIANSSYGTYRQSAGLEGSFGDFMAWSHARLIDLYNVDGIFVDSLTNLDVDYNEHIGNAWKDSEGRLRPKYPILGTRELMRRLYTIYHGEIKEDGVIINFGGSLAPINVYADVFHRGEGQPMHAEKLREAWVPLEEYRASYDGRRYGVSYLAMNKNFKRLPMKVNHHHAVTLLHDLGFTKATLGGIQERQQGYGADDQPHSSIWETRTWLPLDNESLRFYFYEDQRVVRPDDPDLLSSAFTSNDGERSVIVVSNLDEEPVKTGVTLDFEGLGMKAGSYVLEDSITGEPVELDGDSFTIDILPERYRLLRLYVE